MTAPHDEDTSLGPDPEAEEVRGVPLFRDLDDHGLGQVARAFRRVSAAAGDILFRQGAPGDAFYLVSSGGVQIVSDAEAGQVVLADLGPGQYFGEMALVTGSPRTAAAVVARDSELLVLTAGDFHALVPKLPMLRRSLERVTEHRRGAGRVFQNEAYGLLALAGANEPVSIGSDPSNTIVLDMPGVAPLHAEIRRDGASFLIVDLASGAGTYHNREAVSEARLAEGDTIWLGSARLFLHDATLKLFQPSHGLRIDAAGLGRTLSGGRTILEDANVGLRPGELVAIVGPSGAGKTTLLHLLLGLDSPSAGEVFYDGVPLSGNFDVFRPVVAYVPQGDIVHSELTVRESLRHSARLRLPPAERTPAGVERRVGPTLDLVRLAEAADTRVGRLSGGERKRASVAVELLSRPRVIFLDEPTSGLDPGLDDQLMHGFRDMADTGCTVVLTTHATRNIRICDRVVVLCGGRVAFVGTPREALQHFGVHDFVEVYPLLAEASPSALAARFRESSVYSRNGTANPTPATNLPAPALPLLHPAARVTASLRQVAQQYLALLRRDVLIISRRPLDLALRLLGAPLLAASLLMIVDREIFALGASQGGNARAAITLLYLMSAISLFLGAFSACNVLTAEDAIYRRERLVNLSPTAYVAAKVTALACFAVVQAGLMVAVVAPFVEFPPPHPRIELIVFAVIALTTFGGMMMGLFISAVSPNADRAAVLAVLAIIPQLIFGGSTVPRSEMTVPAQLVSDATITKWALELLGENTGLDRRLAIQSVHGLDLPRELGGVVNVQVETPFDDAFKPNGPPRWAALSAFGAVFIAGTLLVQSRKGRGRRRKGRRNNPRRGPP